LQHSNRRDGIDELLWSLLAIEHTLLNQCLVLLWKKSWTYPSNHV